MRLLIATNNAHKIEEFKKIFDELKVNITLVTPNDLNIDIDVDETGSTLDLNAEIKAKAFYKIAGIPVISDDTGLEVKALDGLPGVYSSRYAGANCDSAANRKKLIEEIQKTGSNDWTAHFRTALCYYDGSSPKFFYGICVGKIIDQEKGDGGFGYDSIFIPDGFENTFAELDESQKNAISHRGNAIRFFAKAMKENPPKTKLAFLASGTGSNMEAILRKIADNELNAEGVLLITNNSSCGATTIAKKYGMQVRHISSAQFANDTERDEEIANALLKSKAELVILAGYMKQIGMPIIKRFNNRILNIHPALLPKFGGQNYYGMNVHKAVLEAGEKESGCTIHIVNKDYDKGRILAQKIVPVNENDTPETLQKRILKQEHILYTETIRNIIDGNIKL